MCSAMQLFEGVEHLKGADRRLPLGVLAFRLEPVQELVPEALSDLINIPRVAITVIDGVRDDALKALVTPALVNELAKIDAAA